MCAYVNACYKRLKFFLVLKVKKLAPVDFLDVEDADEFFALSSS